MSFALVFRVSSRWHRWNFRIQLLGWRSFVSACTPCFRLASCYTSSSDRQHIHPSAQRAIAAGVCLLLGGLAAWLLGAWLLVCLVACLVAWLLGLLVLWWCVSACFCFVCLSAGLLDCPPHPAGALHLPRAALSAGHRHGIHLGRHTRGRARALWIQQNPQAEPGYPTPPTPPPRKIGLVPFGFGKPTCIQFN